MRNVSDMAREHTGALPAPTCLPICVFDPPVRIAFYALRSYHLRRVTPALAGVGRHQPALRYAVGVLVVNSNR